LLRLEPEHEIAVVEMGMNHAGEIAALARIAAPDWGVVTNVGTAHIENFADGQAGIARAKFELVAALPANGVAFLNCDDAYVSQFGRDFPGRVVYFGAGPCADPQILEAKRRSLRAARQVSRRRARAYADAAIAGRAQRLQCHGRSGRRARSRRRSRRRRRRAQSLTAGDKRGQVIEIDGATILNDSYNSNPEALRSMIRTLAARPAERRILVAGRDAGTGRARVRSARRLRAAPLRRQASTWWPVCRETRCIWPRPPAPAASQSLFLPGDARREAAGQEWLKQILQGGRRGAGEGFARRAPRSGRSRGLSRWRMKFWAPKTKPRAGWLLRIAPWAGAGHWTNSIPSWVCVQWRKFSTPLHTGCIADAGV
jgi:hypothetical protein